MSKPKHTQEFLKKRQMLLFAPAPILACLTALFALGGGGKGVSAATVANSAPGASGLNHTLPSAGKTTLFANKMEAASAPKDSTHRNGLTSGLAFTPVGQASTTSPAAAPSTGAAPGAAPGTPAPAGLNYAVQPGQAGGHYDPNTDPNVVAMQTRMQRLQEQTSTQPTASAPAATPATASAVRRGGISGATLATDNRMDASLKELDELKNQYQKRLLSLNSSSPAAAATPVTTSSREAKKGITVVIQAPKSVVSSLTRSQTVPAASGFHTLGETSSSAVINSVPAVIHNDQVVEQGSTVKLRLLQDVQLEGRLIPRNSFLYGTCNLTGNRLTIAATSVQYQGNLLPVSLKAFDIDGNEGLNIPGSIDRDALKQGAAQGVSSADLLTMSPSLTAQAAGIAIQTGKALTGRKIKTVKIHLKANYQLLLKS